MPTTARRSPSRWSVNLPSPSDLRKSWRSATPKIPRSLQVRASLRALLALKRKRPNRAVDLLPTGGAYELAPTGTSFDFFYGLLHRTYVRGLAYLELRRYAEAAAAFQTIVDHPAL